MDPRVLTAPARATTTQAALRFRLMHLDADPLAWQLVVEGGGARFAWQLPRGIPWGEGEARPAEEETTIAPGETWDSGACSRESGTHPDEVVLKLHGERVRGRYALDHERGARWRLRRLDPPSLRPMPRQILPMLAHAAPYPQEESEYSFEPKWDGIRALAYVTEGRLRLKSRSLLDITTQYPELAALGDALGERDAVLDGEIVAFDESGRASFEKLQNRLGVGTHEGARQRSVKHPVRYMVFDVLYLDGRDLTSQPYEERRGTMESLGLEDGLYWGLTPARIGDGRGLLETPGLEGVVAKRLGSAYEPGARSRAWLKIKQQKRQELVIGGWTPGRGARIGQIGALLVGRYSATPDEARESGIEPRFLYAGSAGTGFSERMLADLRERLEPLRVERSPFADPVDKKGACFVRPELVAEFEFTEWTSAGRLRHPSFKGLRFDKDPRFVVREED